MAKLMVTWNQRSYPMADEYREPYDGSNISVSFNNNEGTITWLKAGKYGYGCATYVKTPYRTQITRPCVVYLAYDLYTTISGSWSFEYSGQLPSTPITVSPNIWIRVAFIYTVTGSGTDNARELIPNLRNSTAQVGDTAIIKNNILVNLTQMYGAGNEPTSVQEFEAQCALNGIDLSTYHPVNITGTQRVWYTEEKMYETVSSTTASVRDIKSQPITKTTFSILPKKYIGNDAISGTNITAIDGYTGCEINEAEEVHFLMPKEGTSWNDNGIYVEYLGNGFYRAHASAATNGGYSEYIEINQPFTITSVANGGQLWLNNTVACSADIFLYDSNKNDIDYWSMSSVNRKITSDGSMAGKTLRYIRIKALSNSFDVVLRPLFLKNHYSTTTIDWSSTAETVYVGYLYPISGELMSSSKIYTFDGTEDWKLRGVGSSTSKWPYYYLTINDPIQTGWCVCSHAPHSTRVSLSNQTIGCNVANLSSYGLSIYIRPDSNDVVWNNVEAFKAWLAAQYQNGTPMKVIVRTNAPTSYTITPTSLSTRKGKSCFWSNMNGGSSAMYPIYDSHDIIVARNKVALNEPHIETAEGKMITFNTDVPAKLNECKINFLPIQNGTGTPSPTNVRAINGRTGLILNVSENIYGGTQYTVDWQTDVGTIYGGYINLANGTLVQEWDYAEYDGSSDENWNVENITASNKNFYIMTPSTWMRNTKNETTLICNEAPSVSSLGIGDVRITASGDLNAYFGPVSDASTVADFKTWLSTHILQVACKLQTPVLYQLSPQSIKTLRGVNNIWANEDINTTIRYWAHANDAVSHNTIGGLPVLVDNVCFANADGALNGNLVEDSDWFITGWFDTGSTGTKSYTFSAMPLRGGVSSGTTCVRFFNDKSASSVDYWNATTQYTTRTVSSAGRYVAFSVYKPAARYAYCYDNTNGRYLFYGTDALTTIGGLPILINNARYSASNGKYDSIVSDSAYFISGWYDSGSTATKGYKFADASTHANNMTSRWYNDKTATSVDYWRPNNGNNKTMNSPGQFVVSTIAKEIAASFYLLDTTNNIYLYKGYKLL